MIYKCSEYIYIGFIYGFVFDAAVFHCEVFYKVYKVILICHHLVEAQTTWLKIALKEKIIIIKNQF